MIVRKYGNKFKFCRLYEDDVFGYLNVRPKKTHKFLNAIYFDFFKVDFFYKKINKKLVLFSYKLKKVIRKLFQKYFYTNNQDDPLIDINLFKSNEVIFFFKHFFEFIKKPNLNFNSFLYFLKVAIQKEQLAEDEELEEFLKRKFKLKFNFRVDVGKPKREKKRVTLYSERLLNRHRLRFFAGKMTARQFRSYVKKKRSSKYFGSYFIWFLESRLDTIFYRLNLQVSSYKSRQYIRHKGLFVNNIFINIPSFRLKFQDLFSLINKKVMHSFLLFKFFKKMIFTSLPNYYEVNHRIMTMTFFFRPNGNNMIFYPFDLEIQRLGGLGEKF
jgi:small subunit ribosomal protein S4